MTIPRHCYVDKPRAAGVRLSRIVIVNHCYWNGRRAAPGLAFAIFACVASGAWGQQRQPVMLDEVVITATRTAQPRAAAGLHTTVITANDIASSGQQTLVELLQTRGGVQITNSGGLGQPSAVLIRGAEPRHTLVLIDGLRLSSATAGMTAFENLPLSQIDRIEIVAAPLSGVYGSDAIGGVIQIFTKRRSGDSARLGVGSFRTGEVNAAMGRSVGDTDFNLGVAASFSGGFDSTRTSIPFAQHHPDRDSYRSKSFSARFAHHIGDNHEFGMTAFHNEGVTAFDAGLATDDTNHQTLSAYALHGRTRIGERWDMLLRLGTTRDKSVTRGAFPGYFQTDQHQATWQNEIKLGPGTILAGLDYLDQRVASDTVFKQTGRTTAGAFGGYSGVFGNHNLQLSARHDESSQFGGQNTGTLAYGYRFTPAVKLRAAIGTAFKAPSFNDLYFPDFPPFFFSNPNLRPEHSRSREMGLDFEATGHRLALTAFDNRISDLITIFTDTSTFVSTTRNLDQARIRGIDLEYRGKLSDWQISAHAAVHDPRDDSTGFVLRRRARQFASVAVSRQLGHWSVLGEVTASGARYDSTTEAANTRLHGYALLNLGVGYALSPQWNLNLRWNNVLNRDYELVQFFNTPRGNVFLWLAYKP